MICTRNVSYRNSSMKFNEPQQLPDVTDNPLQLAFKRRAPLMPWRDKQAVEPERWTDIWQQICHQSAKQRHGQRLTYVHIPFCANHCLFCGFYRNKYRTEFSSTYTDALLHEIDKDIDLHLVGDQPIDALYFGGGTPTALETKDLARLIEEACELLPLSNDCEITLEGRIHHFSPDKIKACLDAGVNRISIGIQSFDSQVRQSQGRRATGEEAAVFIADLISWQRATIVIDLMYGMPQQTPEIWEQDIATSLQLAPDGLDIYCMNVFPGTPLFAAIKANKVQPTATLAEQAEMFGQAFKKLRDASWQCLSNSHWGRNDRERNRYNRLIKTGVDTLAFGSGAGGSAGDFSYSLSGDLQDYYNKVSSGEKALTGMQQADAYQSLRDQVTGDMETGKLSLPALKSIASTQFSDSQANCLITELEPMVEHWQRAGLARMEGELIVLTIAGRFWSNNLVTTLNQRVTHTLTNIQRGNTK